MTRERRSPNLFPLDELRPSLLLRFRETRFFLFQFVDALCGNAHGLGGDVVAVHGALKREYELAFIHLPAADGPELGAFLGSVFQVMEAELRRAVAEERARLFAEMSQASRG